VPEAPVSTYDRDRPEEARPGGDDVTARVARSDHHPINWLLLVPLVITLFPPLYNSIDPTLADIPFFYWYQLAAILVSVVVTLVVYRKTRV
jgi:hypothetical protein